MSRRTAPRHSAHRMRKAPSTTPLDGLRTPDHRYIVVRGRLWRASNPGLTDAEHSRWTRRLMSARRAVGRALRQEDPAAERRARGRVRRAKVALGERGPVWWTDDAPDYHRRLVRNTPYREWYGRAQQWADTIERLLIARASHASICPSDVSRAAAPSTWRRHLQEVRDIARHLARQQRLQITQRGRMLDPAAEWRGPVRFRRPTPSATPPGRSRR